MIQLIYSSRETVAFDQSMLDALLAKARRNNAQLDITGLLLYDAGDFLQILEGPGDAVADLYALIERDERHRDARIVHQQAIADREFGDWGMAFARADSLNSSIDGFNEYHSEMVEFYPDASRAMKMIYMFQEGVLRHSAQQADGEPRVKVQIQEGRSQGRAVSIASRSAYLLEFARVIAMSLPDVDVAFSDAKQHEIRFNVRNNLERGGVELF